MAVDNIPVTGGSGYSVAAENISGNLLQRVKVAIGTLDVDGGDVSSSNPMPVTVSTALPVGSNVIGGVTQSGSNWTVLDAADGTVAAGTAASYSTLVGAQYNATLPAPTTGQQMALQADSSGRLLTASSPLDGQKATYSATSALAFASASSATDIFTITGSASKTVRVLRIGFSGTQTTAGTVNVLAIKRSSANSGGTSASATAVVHDSTDGAVSATVLNYTANPTSLGTAVGTVRAVRAFIPTTGTAASSQFYEFDFGEWAEKAVVLRGTSQVLALNLNATTVTGGAWTCWVEWSEE